MNRQWGDTGNRISTGGPSLGPRVVLGLCPWGWGLSPLGPPPRRRLIGMQWLHIQQKRRVRCGQTVARASLFTSVTLSSLSLSTLRSTTAFGGDVVPLVGLRHPG